MQTYPCSKCDGKGTIQGFAHVLNGVCFRCAGSGLQKSTPRRQAVRPLTDYQQQMVTTIREGNFEDADYVTLKTLRDFAFYPLPQVPDLLATWRARGEAYFFAAQDARLHALGYAQ